MSETKCLLYLNTFDCGHPECAPVGPCKSDIPLTIRPAELLAAATVWARGTQMGEVLTAEIAALRARIEEVEGAHETEAKFRAEMDEENKALRAEARVAELTRERDEANERIAACEGECDTIEAEADKYESRLAAPRPLPATVRGVLADAELFVVGMKMTGGQWRLAGSVETWIAAGRPGLEEK